MTSAPPTALIHGALIDATARFDELLRSVKDPKRTAIGHWTVEQVVAHMAVVSYFDAMSCREDVYVPFATDELIELVMRARVSDVETLNAISLDAFPERDLGRLCEHIAKNVGIMSLAVASDQHRPAVWLGGIEVTVGVVAAHFIGEIMLHGLDIARSQGLSWDLRESDALLAFDACYMPILESWSHMLATPDMKPVSVEFRVTGAEPWTVDIEPGRMDVSRTSVGGADVVLKSDALSGVLMMFERISPFAAVASRKVRVGGRRPWRIQRFRRQVSMP